MTCQSRRNVRKSVAVLGLVWLCGVTPASAQVLEDHSLPRSAIKTWQVKCPNGRFALIRYDSRESRPKVCAAVQDGSLPMSCVVVEKAQLAQVSRALAAGLCAQ